MQASKLSQDLKQNRRVQGTKVATFAATLSLPRSFLQQTLFEFFLALDAVARPRHGLQPLGVDFLAAVDALAEAAFANAHQRLLHHLQKLPLVVALAEQKFLGVGAGGAVGNVLGRILVRRAPVLLRAVHGAAQILLPRLQPLLETFQLFLVHRSLQNWAETASPEIKSTSNLLGRILPEASLSIRPNEDDKRQN